MLNFLWFCLFALISLNVVKADEEADLWIKRRASNIHFGGTSNFEDNVNSGLDISTSSNSFRYPRQLSQSAQVDQEEQYHPEAQDDSYYYQSDQPKPSIYASGSFPIANLARGSSSSSGDTFHLSSATSGGFGSMRLFCLNFY